VNWIAFWARLVEANNAGREMTRSQAVESQSSPDIWCSRARAYDEAAKDRWRRPDASRDYLATYVENHPNSSVLDVGAGTGAWTVFFAKRVRRVTALDPSPAMLTVLGENVAAEGLTNVTIIHGAWPQTEVSPHDLVFCAHALYGVADFRAAITAMGAAARRRCVLLLRMPTRDSILAQAAQRIWGHRHDSPNLQIAYNALLQMGIYPEVRMEDPGGWRPRIMADLDEALARVRRRLALPDPSEYDSFLRDLLRRHLRKTDAGYLWERQVRSGLLTWEPRLSAQDPG
jgi:SAM-dependent methyltransferase